jgi:hypothetical protein
MEFLAAFEVCKKLLSRSLPISLKAWLIDPPARTEIKLKNIKKQTKIKTSSLKTRISETPRHRIIRAEINFKLNCDML